jgi:sirohydrochlorin cobaltochelatase
LKSRAGIILFAHGSREPQWARPFEQLAARVAKKSDAAVKLAFLEQMAPTLDEAIAALAAEGVTRVRVVPVFLGRGGHVRADLPGLVDAAAKRYPKVSFSIDAPIGEQAAVIDAIASAITGKKN